MRYALTNVNIITGHNTNEILKNKIVIVNNNKIVSIQDTLNGKIKRIDLNGRYLMPGLINLHVHLPGSGMPNHRKKQTKESVRKLMKFGLSRRVIYSMCKKFAKTELLSGVTTIRTVGGLSNFDSRIAENIASRKIVGPRMLTSNLAISVPNGHMDGILAHTAHNPLDAIQLVHKVASDKVNWIKLMITGGVTDAVKEGEPGVLRMAPEIVKAACNQAHILGLKVSAHVESTEGIRVALENGVDTIEHGASLEQSDINLFKKHKASLVCTLSPAFPLVYLNNDLTRLTHVEKVNSKVVFDGIINCAKSCLENDIPVGLGTDTACLFSTHYNMWRELVYFCKFVGVTPSFAIHTATLKNAQILGVDNITGSIEVGKSADFIVLEDNPIINLNTLQNPYMVGFRGRIFRKPRVKKYKLVDEALDRAITNVIVK